MSISLSRSISRAAVATACGIATAVLALSIRDWRNEPTNWARLTEPAPVTSVVPASGSGPRVVYRHSVVPGGIYSATEASDAATRDTLVRRHYAGLKLTELRPALLETDLRRHVSYRRDGKIFWTRTRHRVARGETVLADGSLVSVRARCGNLLSEHPKMPVAPEEQEPTEGDLEQYGSDDEATPPAIGSSVSDNAVADVLVESPAPAPLLPSGRPVGHPEPLRAAASAGGAFYPFIPGGPGLLPPSRLASEPELIAANLETGRTPPGFEALTPGPPGFAFIVSSTPTILIAASQPTPPGNFGDPSESVQPVPPGNLVQRPTPPASPLSNPPRGTNPADPPPGPQNLNGPGDPGFPGLPNVPITLLNPPGHPNDPRIPQVPEPSSMVLAATGIALLALARRYGF